MPPTPPSIASQIRRRIAPALLSAAVALASPALAQGNGTAVNGSPDIGNPAACQRYRAELASLGSGASAQYALGSEIARLESYYRSLDCEGGRFLFFDTRPPQCGAVEQRIKALRSGYGAENGEVVAARRRQLVAAIGTVCVNQPTLGPDGQALLPQQTARGGGNVICVKTCDGSYFPMNNLPDGRAGADEMCQALCPGTEAVAYSMPAGDDGLRSAATIKGNRAYVAMKNAFRFRTSFEPSCSCKREGQGWVQSLAKAESMLFRHKGDIFVTPMQAEALSRPPKVRLTLVGRADKTAASLAADVAASRGTTLVVSDVPGATEIPAGATTVAADPRGPAASSSAIEERPSIRVIAPAMIPVPARTGTP